MANEPNGVARPEFVNLVGERSRTYHFPNGEAVTLFNVEKIAVSKSGTHRLETDDGAKHIVPAGWIHIEFDADEWTF